MWPWRKSPPNPELLERLETVEGQLKSLRRALTDLDDSCAQRFGRLFKRVQRDQEAPEAPPAADQAQLTLQPFPQADPRPTAAQRFGGMHRRV